MCPKRINHGRKKEEDGRACVCVWVCVCGFVCGRDRQTGRDGKLKFVPRGNAIIIIILVIFVIVLAVVVLVLVLVFVVVVVVSVIKQAKENDNGVHENNSKILMYNFEKFVTYT